MGNKIIVRNNKVRTVLSEETKKLGYMSIEEAKRLTREALLKQWQILQERDDNNG